ncbi:ribonucleoprotein [Nymphaea thermarum]|nr:ribonucleoprotein [Nymphaea thermarum]
MVLSNKKLKQKIRATLAASALGKLSEGESKKRKRDGDGAAGSHLQSVKDIPGSSIKLPRLSKREKRRQKQSFSSDTQKAVDGTPAANSNAADQSQNSSAVNGEKKEKKKKKKEKEKRNTEETEPTVAEGETGDGKKKQKKKRKREEAEQKVEGKEMNDAKKEKNKKKRKKKIKKKGKKANEKEENQKEISDPQLEKTNGSEEKVDVSTKLYVGGIPYYSSEDDIRSFFDGCGTITEMDCMTFPQSGKFRGIAILTFKTDAAAKRALALDGADMGGLFLKIQPYRATRAEKTDFTPERVEGYNRIYMGNLSWDVTEEDIRKLLSDCKIKAIRFGTNKDTDEFLGYAHVDFADDVSLGMALTLDQQMVCDRPVKIRCAAPKKGAEIKKDSGSVPSKASKKRRTCYTCGIPGHLSSSCPQKQQPDKKPSSDGGK